MGIAETIQVIMGGVTALTALGDWFESNESKKKLANSKGRQDVEDRLLNQANLKNPFLNQPDTIRGLGSMLLGRMGERSNVFTQGSDRLSQGARSGGLNIASHQRNPAPPDPWIQQLFSPDPFNPDFEQNRIHRFATGTPRVQGDQLAQLHDGEAIVPAAENPLNAPLAGGPQIGGIPSGISTGGDAATTVLPPVAPQPIAAPIAPPPPSITDFNQLSQEQQSTQMLQNQASLGMAPATTPEVQAERDAFATMMSEGTAGMPASGMTQLDSPSHDAALAQFETVQAQDDLIAQLTQAVQSGQMTSEQANTQLYGTYPELLNDTTAALLNQRAAPLADKSNSVADGELTPDINTGGEASVQAPVDVQAISDLMASDAGFRQFLGAQGLSVDMNTPELYADQYQQYIAQSGGGETGGGAVGLDGSPILDPVDQQRIIDQIGDSGATSLPIPRQPQPDAERPPNAFFDQLQHLLNQNQFGGSEFDGLRDMIQQQSGMGRGFPALFDFNQGNPGDVSGLENLVNQQAGSAPGIPDLINFNMNNPGDTSGLQNLVNQQAGQGGGLPALWNFNADNPGDLSGLQDLVNQQVGQGGGLPALWNFNQGNTSFNEQSRRGLFNNFQNTGTPDDFGAGLRNLNAQATSNPLLDQVAANPTGFGGGVLDDIINQGVDRSNTEFAALERQMKDAAAIGGGGGSGRLQDQIGQNEMARIGQNVNIGQNARIGTAQQGFENLLGSLGAQQGVQAQQFAQSLNTVGMQQQERQNQMQRALDTFHGGQMSQQNEFSNLFNTTGAMQSDMQRRMANQMGLEGMQEQMSQNRFGNLLNTTGAMQSDMQRRMANQMGLQGMQEQISQNRFGNLLDTAGARQSDEQRRFNNQLGLEGAQEQATQNQFNRLFNTTSLRGEDLQRQVQNQAGLFDASQRQQQNQFGNTLSSAGLQEDMFRFDQDNTFRNVNAINELGVMDEMLQNERFGQVLGLAEAGGQLSAEQLQQLLGVGLGGLT